MTDVHPDHLLDLRRRGALDELSRARLEAHLAGCRACALEVQLGEDLAGEGAARPGDAAAIERAIAGAMAAAPRRRGKRWGVRVAVALAAVLVIATAFAALRRSAPRPAPAVASATALASAPAIASAPPPEIAPAPATEVASSPAMASASAIATAPAAGKITAAELFARANEARRKGQNEEAVRLYRELAKIHPASAEALTARVALGRLLLDRMNDPAGAGREFRAYLAAAPGGTLDEEARVGLALAAAKLGDVAGERDAWRGLLEKHPDSVQADRARKRLDELSP